MAYPRTLPCGWTNLCSPSIPQFLPAPPGAGLQLSGEPVDALNEALAVPPDRAAWSVAIVRLIEEMHATLQWLRGSASGNAELASLAQVVAAARAHQDRMASR